MKRWYMAVLVGLLALHGVALRVAAQYPLGGYSPPYRPQPTVSPYLNLYRGGTLPGINYYGMVRPQLQTAQQLQNLQTQQNVMANEITTGGMMTAGQPVPVATTGHPVFYFDYSRYFPLGGLPNGGAMGMGGGVGVGFGAGGAGPMGGAAIMPIGRPGGTMPNVGVGVMAPR